MGIKLRFFALLLIFSFLFITTCQSPHTDAGMGTFTISFGSNIHRTVYPPNIPPDNINADPDAPSLEDLKFTITFTDLDGVALDPFTFEGNTPLRGSVPVGVYNIAMNVYLLIDDSLYALGDAIDNPVTIVSGPNPTIRFQLDAAPGIPIQSRTIIGMTLLSPPTGPSYQGMMPDLTGMTVELSYIGIDGQSGIEVISDATSFAVIAPAAGGTESPFIEQDITPQTIQFRYIEAGHVFTGTVDVDVVALLSANLTGTATKQDYYTDDPMDFSGLTLEGLYADGITRNITMSTIRERNWYGSNTYYLWPDSSPRRLMEIGPPHRISYRVASGDVPVPTLEQARGEVPRDLTAHPTGTEIFVDFPITNLFYVISIDISGGLSRTFPQGTLADDINWIEELRNENIIITVHYDGTALTKTYNMNEFELFMPFLAAALIPSDTVLAPGSTLAIYYFGVLYSMTLNIVP